MKKIAILSAIGCMLTFFNDTYALNECRDAKISFDNALVKKNNIWAQYDSIETNIRKDLWWRGLTSTDIAQRVANARRDILPEYNTASNEYDAAYFFYRDCLETQSFRLTDLWRKWVNSFYEENYDDAITFFKEYTESIESDNSNYDNAKLNLAKSYSAKWTALFNQGEFKDAIKSYNSSVAYWNETYEVYTNIWLAYTNLQDYQAARLFFQKSIDKAPNMSSLRDANDRIKKNETTVNEQENFRKTLKEEALKAPIDKWFMKIRVKYGVIRDNEKRRKKYIELRNALYTYRWTFFWDKQFVLEYLISLTEKEINRK